MASGRIHSQAKNIRVAKFSRKKDGLMRGAKIVEEKDV
jgi:hypothetical protein